MSYRNHGTYTNGYPPQQYPGPQYNGYVDPRQTNQGVVNGHEAYGSNAYQTNGNYTSGPIQSSPRGFQNQPRAPQQSLSQQQQYTQSLNPQPAYYQQQYAQPAQQQQRHPTQQQQRQPAQHQQRQPAQQQQRQPAQQQQRQPSQQQQRKPSQQQPRHPPQQQQQSQQPPTPPKPRGFAPAILSPPPPPPPPVQNVQHGFVHMSDIQAQAVPTVPTAAPIDYQNLLLSLADEFLVAAYEIGATADTAEDHNKRQEYYQLIANGLVCLDTLLKKCKLAPEKEAKLRLWYASILYEETENTMEAEEALSKGISVCERHKYFDLKYNMQHLLARVTFTKNAKAAFKFLEQVIEDAKAYKHTAWEYGFRFLKVSLHLTLSLPHDLAVAHNQLELIANLASDRGDKAILAMAKMKEAMLYLKEPGESGGFEDAQTALASVQSLQLDQAIATLPQLTSLISFVDISCNLQRFSPQTATTSMRNMQDALSQLKNQDNKDSDGTLALPLSKGSTPPPSTESGIIRRRADGSLTLMFNWMPDDDVYDVAYLLSGIALACGNAIEDHKSERMFVQYLRSQQWAQILSNKVAKSLILSVKQQCWRERMAYHTHLYHTFVLVSRSAYADARDQIAKVKQLHSAWPDVPKDFLLMTRYLKGMIAQGTGDLVPAFSAFESLIKDICPSGEYANETKSQNHIRNITQLRRELYILSNMNILQIIRRPNHPSHGQFDDLLTQIAPFSPNNPNRGIVAAYHLINAAAPALSKILSTKQALLWGNLHARAIVNNKLNCMILNTMSWKFFEGIVAAQAEQSVLACLTTARRCADTLWISVSAGVVADKLVLFGKYDEAAQVQAEGVRAARDLPPRIREEMMAIQEEMGADLASEGVNLGEGSELVDMGFDAN